MTPELPEVPAVKAMISRLASQMGSTDNDDNNEAGLGSQSSVRTPHRSPNSKGRSLSDSTPQLSPSPKFREPPHISKDDHHAIPPRTPRRPELLSRGLSLQMPPQEMPIANSVAHFAARVPLSPQLDAHNTYASPASLLPRRSRGAEFSRACTNLHHSTLVDQSSPDSSPTITQKGMMIPRKPRTNSMILDSPNINHSTWGMGNGDRTAASSSLGSINMLGSDDSSSSSDEGDPMDPDFNDDPMLMTPQAMKSHNTPFGGLPIGANPGGWSNMFSPSGPPTFMSIQRARLRKGRSRKSSSSASGHSSLASPGPASPPNGNGKGEGYFNREAVMRKPGSRRESLSLFANDLHISSGNDSGDEAVVVPQTPGVVRRPVTRRGNLLPKSRQFGRIKAELIEESAPIDSEFRREAEIIRQVRESDVDLDRPSNTTHSSPNLLPTVPGLDGPLEGVPEEESESSMSLDGSATKGLFAAFNVNVARNANGRGSWHHVLAQTPPPPSFPRAGSSAISEDINMDSPSTSISQPSTNAMAAPESNSHNGWASRSSTPQPVAPISAADGLKKSNKRRRDDDLDGNSIKRRAVSPGVSVQNSPVLSQSPAQRDSGVWQSAPKANRENTATSGHAAGERSNSGGSVSMTPLLGPKRVGLQGMTDANDGFMKMSIE
ncbi:hypothetical protein BU24DRAFT_75206 [Aaosphaeria arxii CBS 175.79]|uniref:Uncharacterized protein n=1 Tax=Aaosphaeria arxii CBS 175.79 TaxID=1450172 RepID=A0A6A5X9M1_9PLEO|nr:uncharacterized protein BU24DRAFT_75206 [Aaosphaeria arxii CBS 175.79]KAF2009444.1 hypothetical protein BU24DRAFT_75206 [Aaosphaeria arxii CBS 175.79]